MNLADLPPEDSVFSVFEITSHLRHVLESNLPAFFVQGEVANLTRHRSGHWYFSLKDANATLRCVFFRNWNRLCAHKPVEGDKVICGGRITIYEKGGNYQLTVERLLPVGAGDLQQRFERLKRKLDAEGLFAPERKRPLPPFPAAVGVITSPTGAAWQDIRNVLTRRWPCRVALSPVRVQGAAAAGEMVRALRRLAREPGLDVIIIGRGGGSQEDLFVFNDETLVRAIADCPIPVVSAVGHEIDYTLCDFVADLRAPTPSAAAELIVPDRREVATSLESLRRRAFAALRHKTHGCRAQLALADHHLTEHHPRRLVQSYQQRLDEATLRLRHSATVTLSSRRGRLNMVSQQLQELSPRQALKRGYAILSRHKKLIRSVRQIAPGQTLDIILQDGTCTCEARSLREHDSLS
ncbi:MAG: exodeoxyribonuclease VII large subunit [Candidatus Cloacimonetes bacterium]|nr:exodeoxyribonuclease VII large subunit [Candidatus Cloacimonadota bacterium]